MVKGAGPKKGDPKSTQYHVVEVRTHSADVNFHDASKASYGKYSQCVSTKKHEWGVKEGKWIKKQDLTKEQMDAAHISGGN